jgi:hypothetical protein
MNPNEFYDLLKVLRGRLSNFGQNWNVTEIEGNEAPVASVEIYENVLDFYEMIKTNQPKMFTEVLNKCILAVQRCSWRALTLSEEEVTKQLDYEMKKGNMSSSLVAGITQEQEPVKKSNK